METAFSETRRAARLLQQFGGFSFWAAGDGALPPLVWNAARQSSPNSIGSLVRFRAAGKVLASLPLERELSYGGYVVVKVWS